MKNGSNGHRALRWWEERPIPMQLVVAALALVPLWTVIHLVFLNQPLLWRGIIYGVFWGGLSAGAVVGATRSERAKRLAREQKS
jgi:hypothetical protein